MIVADAIRSALGVHTIGGAATAAMLLARLLATGYGTSELVLQHLRASLDVEAPGALVQLAFRVLPSTSTPPKVSPSPRRFWEVVFVERGSLGPDPPFGCAFAPERLTVPGSSERLTFSPFAIFGMSFLVGVRATR